MTTSARDTLDDTTATLEREYDAPRALVWDAWTKREHLEKWFGPHGFECTYELDLRVGGAFRLRLRGMGFDNTVTGVYREIVPGERIVQTSRFTDVPDLEFTTTVTFGERHGKTTVKVEQRFPRSADLTPAQRAAIDPRRQGSLIGWSQTLENLGRILTRRSA